MKAITRKLVRRRFIQSVPRIAAPLPAFPVLRRAVLSQPKAPALDPDTTAMVA